MATTTKSLPPTPTPNHAVYNWLHTLLFPIVCIEFWNAGVGNVLPLSVSIEHMNTCLYNNYSWNMADRVTQACMYVSLITYWTCNHY